MLPVGRAAPRAMARAYFALQAVTGAVWWAAVFASDTVRDATLGTWDPAIVAGPDLVLFVGMSAMAALRGSRIVAAIAAAWTILVTVALGTYGLIAEAAGWGVVLMGAATVGSLASAATMWAGTLPTRWFFVGPLAFRVAAERPAAHHLGRSLAQLVVFWTTFFVAVPLLLLAVEARLHLEWPALDRPSVRAVGATCFVIGSVAGLWSCITMAIVGNGTPLPADTARELVIAGPYRYVRNPMALAGALQTAGVGLVLGSWTVVAIAVAGAAVWDVLIRPTEEADLLDRFDEPYRRYAEEVRCWVPRRPAGARSGR